MKIKSSVFLAAIFATLSLSAQNFTYNFDGTDNDAWVDGDGLNSVVAFLPKLHGL